MSGSCGHCFRCIGNRRLRGGLTVGMTRMIVCPTCGNKRCPHATDHGNHLAAIKMVKMQGGVFGAVSTSHSLIEALP